MGNLKDIRRRAAERKAKREKENLQRQNIQTTITTDNAQQTAIDNNNNRAENELAKAQEVFDNAFDNAFATVTPKQRPQSTNGRMNVPKQYQNADIHRANRMYATDGNMDFGKSDEQLGITTEQLQKGYEEDQKRRENEQNEMYQYLQQLKKEYYDNAEIGGLYDNTIRKLLNDSETLYNAPKPSNDFSKGTIVEDFKNFGKGLKDKVASEDFLTVGISDARDAYNLNRVSKSYIDKYNTALQSTKDEQEAARIAFSQLSKAEKGVMLAMQLKTQIEQSRQGNTSLAYTAAGVTGDMLPFALQLMTSAGIGNILNAGAKATAKQVSKNSAKQIGKALSNKWVKNTETAIINTAISPMTHSDFANERFNARIQEHRELTGKEKAKITARNFFENITETVGGELLKDTGKITGRFVQKQANKIPVLNDMFSTLSKNNSEWQKFLNTITDNKVSRTMREKGYIGNFAEEYGEEGLGAVLNTAFGSVIQDEDMKQGLKEFVSSDNQKVLLLSLLVGTSAMPAVSRSIGFVSQNKNLQEYRKAKEKFSNQLTSLGFDGKIIISAIEISIGNGDFNQYAIKRDLKQSLQGYGIKDTPLFDMDKAINDYTEKAGKVKNVMQELDNKIRLMGENEKDLFFEDLSKELRRQAQNNVLYHNIKEGYYFPMTDIQTGKKENYLAQVQSKDGALGFVIRKFKNENGNVIFRVKNDAGVVRDMTIEDIRQENIGGKYENELITFTKVSQVLDYLQTQADNSSPLKTEIELRNLLADYIELDSEGSQTVNTGLTTDGRQIFINNINQETGTVTGLVQNEYGYEREQLNISDIATMQPQNIDDIILSTNLIFDNINQENDIPDFEQKTQQHFIDELKNNYHKNTQEHFKKGNRIRLKVKDGIQIPEILQQNEKEGVIERADNDSIQVRFDNGEIRIYPIDNNNYYFENISDNATEDKVISDNNGINEKQNDKESQGIKNKIKSGEIYNNDIENTYDELLKVLENTEDTDLFINNKIEQLNNIMSKVKNPKTADIERIKRARQKTDNIKSNISYWQKVKQIPVIREQNKDYQVRKAQEEQRQKEKTKQKKTIQKNIIEKSGINNIRQKFEKTKQITGHKGTKTLSDGEKIIGRYILIESTGLTPSHDIEKNFIQSEGFPTREDGTTLNDRDYQKDKQAQEQVRQKADKYDGRAVNDMPIADNNGIILSGNDRTMAGQLAGKQNTDTSYLESLKENAKQYGFTKEDIDTMQHPRLVFVLDEDMNYTTENFAKFNHNEKKSQNNVEKAVKVGKTIKEDTLRKIAKVIAEFESIAECLRDKNGTSDIIDLLVNDGQIHRNDVAGFLNDGVFNEAGKEYIQTILVGATLNETSVRQINALPFMRNSILSALNEILVNNNLKEYSLKEELDGAIHTVYEAHKHSEGKQGEDLKAYYTQLGLFGENNLKSKTTMMLADKINSVKINDLKTCLNSYNKAAGESANGDVDMFSGKVKSKEDILTDVLEGLDYTEKRNKKLQYILTEKKDYINKKEEPTNDKQQIENEQRKEEKIVSQTDISRKEDSNDTVTQDKQQKKDNRTSETVRQQKIYDKELFFRKNLAENIHTYLFYFKGKDEKIFRPYSFSDNSTVTSLMYASLIKRENVENVLRQILPILKETSICQVRDAKGNIYFDSSEQKLKAKQDNSNKNKLVTEDDYEKLKKRMKTKMQGQLNMGIDPEILEIGIQMAVYHIERGTRKFIDYAKAMIKDLGDNIRPYLKSFYNGARDLPEMTELSKEMDSYEDVNKFDIHNFDKEKQINIFDKAKQKIQDKKVREEEKQAKKKLPRKDDGRLDLFSYQENQNNENNNKQDDIAKNENNIEKRLNIFKEIVNDENKNTEDKLKELKLGKDILETSLMDTDTKIKKLNTPSNKNYELWKDFVNIGASREEFEKFQKENEQTLNNLQKERKENSNILDYIHDSIKKLEENDKEQINTTNDEREQGEETGQPAYENERLGENTRQENEQDDERGMDRSSVRNRSNDKTRSGKVSELSYKQEDELKKNQNNWHRTEDGDDIPQTAKARFNANIKAIELMKNILAEDRNATEEEKKVLSKFSGWGGLGTFFTEGNDGYEALQRTLSEDEFNDAALSLNSAFYTPDDIIDKLWQVVKNLGFKGGNILEGSAGVGNILSRIPQKINERSDIQAVEIDNISGNILKLLYPDAQVEIKGFEKTNIKPASVDLAITNVPFVTGLKVWDDSNTDISKKFSDIHNFCIAKNVRCLREGGIGIFITSKGTLDGGTELTQWITSNKGGNADFVGAFRLNNETFKGTKVTSDIIVVRKRVKDRINNDAINLSSIAKLRDVKIEIDDVVKTYPLMYNSYFVEHPENMGGRMFFNSEKGETFRPTSNGLFASEDINQEDRLNKWSESFLKQDKIDIIKEDEETKDYENTTEREGVLTTDSKGNICSSYRGKAIPIGVKVNDKINGYKADECLQDYKNIKDSLQTVLDGQSNDKDDTDEQLKRKQDKLNDVYDKFIRKYGYLSNNRKIRFLKEDVDFPAMMALEDVKEEVSINEKTGKTSTLYKVKKEKVFSQRVIRKENNTIPKNVQDAVVTSIYERGFIDCDIIAEQLGKSKKQVEDEIIDKGLGFINPTTDSIEVSYEYLSGNVRDKLEIAKQNNTDGRFDKNIKALEEILPVWIPAHLINIQIGASWCPSRVFYEYVKDKYEMEQKDFLLTYANGMWITQNSRFGHTHKDREGGVYSKQLEKQIYASDIFLELLNNRTIAVQKTETYYEENIKRTRTITDQQATQMCVAKAEEMKEDFRDWINQKLRNDESLKSEVENIYNNRFNNLVAKEIDDKFLPEHFKGSSIAINLYSHQKKAVMRALTEPLMLAHEVGTGKTFTMITTAMEMKRLGMADKPMIVVQNATLEQFVSQAKRLYPNAHILSPTSNDRTKNGRKYFYSKTKYGNWDFVVVPQSMFNTIPDDPNEKESYTAEKIEEKEQALANFELQRENNSGDSLAQRNDDIAISQLKKDIEKLKNSLTEKGVSAKELKAQAEMKENIKAKVERQLSRKKDEDISTLKDMGIDALFVDEAHEYKRLGFETTMQRVRGIDKSSSQRAVALFLKTKEILKRKGGKNVVFATGTPISNTAAEIWTFMKYLLSKDIMQESGIYYFDDFVRNFGKVAQSLEFTTSGKYRENTRFLGYNGLPELIRMWASCADTVLADENKELDDKIPQTELGGKTARDIFLDQTPSLMRIMKVVKEKLNEFEAMSGKEKKENSHIPLVMYGIAKRAAIDPRLVDADAIDELYSKTNQTVNEILKSLEETKSYKGTVAVFCDRFRRKVNDIAKEFNLFEDMRKKLIAKGVNEEEIFVMKSGMTDTAKAKVFEKVNKGEIRVIMGSTQLLGVGVNIQERLHTLIHMDAPDRPMDYEQRNGRILRQGNLHRQMNKLVRILRFGVKKSLDVTAYQRLKTKQSFIRSIMDGKQRLKNILINREEDEINEEGMFDNPVAMLSGSQYALELNQAKRDYTKYKNKEKEY